MRLSAGSDAKADAAAFQLGEQRANSIIKPHLTHSLRTVVLTVFFNQRLRAGLIHA